MTVTFQVQSCAILCIRTLIEAELTGLYFKIAPIASEGQYPSICETGFIIEFRVVYTCMADHAVQSKADASGQA